MMSNRNSSMMISGCWLDPPMSWSPNSRKRKLSITDETPKSSATNVCSEEMMVENIRARHTTSKSLRAAAGGHGFRAATSWSSPCCRSNSSQTTWLEEYAPQISGLHAVLEAGGPSCSSAGWTEQQEVSSKNRELLFDWLLHVNRAFELSPATLYRGVAILDRMAAIKPITIRQIDTLGLASLIIASKFEDKRPPCLTLFQVDGFTAEQLLQAERTILEALDFDIAFPTAYSALQFGMASTSAQVAEEVQRAAEEELQKLVRNVSSLDRSLASLADMALAQARAEVSHCSTSQAKRRHKGGVGPTNFVPSPEIELLVGLL